MTLPNIFVFNGFRFILAGSEKAMF